MRCRPELAPGHSPIDATRTLAHAAAARIEAGALNHHGNLEDLAASLGISSRQLRRSIKQELGVSPVQLAQTNRLLLAKRLIAETQLPLTQVAFAAGFDSVRRFNSLFQSHYRLAPRALRRSSSPVESDSLRLQLAYRPPLNWTALLTFLAARAIPGVECVSGQTYSRTAAIGNSFGWLSVSPRAERHGLVVDISTSLVPVLSAVLVRVRHLFDLDARPDIIMGHLGADQRLASLIDRDAGLRVPGAFDSFELGCRAILGQQVSVRGASTLSGRLAATFGQEIQTPLPCLNRIWPTARSIAQADGKLLAKIGIPMTRALSLWNLARGVAEGEIDLEPGPQPEAVMAKLVQLPGIGTWTASYIAMRALRWPDAFPATDLGIKKALGLTSTSEIEKVSESWRPWRAYAAMCLWQSLSGMTQ